MSDFILANKERLIWDTKIKHSLDYSEHKIVEYRIRTWTSEFLHLCQQQKEELEQHCGSGMSRYSGIRGWRARVPTPRVPRTQKRDRSSSEQQQRRELENKKKLEREPWHEWRTCPVFEEKGRKFSLSSPRAEDAPVDLSFVNHIIKIHLFPVEL